MHELCIKVAVFKSSGQQSEFPGNELIVFIASSIASSQLFIVHDQTHLEFQSLSVNQCHLKVTKTTHTHHHLM